MATKQVNVQDWNGIDINYFNFENRRINYPTDLLEMVMESLDKEGFETNENHIVTIFPRIYDVNGEGVVCLVGVEFWKKDKKIYRRYIVFQKTKNEKGLKLWEEIKKSETMLDEQAKLPQDKSLKWKNI